MINIEVLFKVAVIIIGMFIFFSLVWITLDYIFEMGRAMGCK